ncbi:MAG: SCO family protein [Candidatus Marinimicrobia bacterium]|jgi:protein SCO1/2|nr:SCO family protein [Candidatus Neomarinimicrobiota bacterium]MBP00047.1 SCO family protein [Candidatus Neomarinimicrobiota bacterium]MEC7622175.1 SCO family protein [Candidatus Neomarinimicrobiota bacterium]MEC7901784.1 SCO family protein [Candidatus Neomarinimicrobiota bacterium]MED5248164.1 SCO family protein [Candidatus Neomarinimicrobiota bacterium]|tara:strand:+ start:1422 stop:2006 length:585 start_codon:yes stop_codon:yes gene_type:complete
MNINTRIKIYIAVAVFLLATYFLNYTGKENELPEIGMVPEFEFVNSEQETITLNNLKGKVWVADFIFTTCTMACPMMTGNMNIIHKKYKKNDDVRLVSISVYPEYDTPEVLTKYASQYDANTSRWYFLTGEESTVKRVIKDGFKIGDYEDIIFHSEKFALVDKKGMIRAYYNGMKTEDMKKLKKDINSLLKQNS